MRCLMRCIIHLTLLKSYFTPRRPLDYISFKQLMKLQALHWTAPIRPVKLSPAAVTHDDLPLPFYSKTDYAG